MRNIRGSFKGHMNHTHHDRRKEPAADALVELEVVEGHEPPPVLHFVHHREAREVEHQARVALKGREVITWYHLLKL